MTLYVADTHALVWYLTDDRRLGRRAAAAFNAAEAGQAHVYIPTIVLAEVMHLSERGRTKVKYDEAVARIARHPGYTIVDLTLDVLASAAQLKGDVEIFERLIAATALTFDAALISRDTVLSAMDNVRLVW